ncbi:MAG: HAD family hydrolase [Thermaerobacter sp.]|nr:HAD family hydrolase [Bacillota bacterium]
MQLRAVLFDLDGTLLDLDMERFLPVYMDALAGFLSDYLPAATLTDAVMASVGAAIADVDPRFTNEDVFWREFRRRTGYDLDTLREPLERFYRDVFPRLGGQARPVPGARDVVADLAGAGLKLALATNPIFPRAAIEARLAWAGIEPRWFDFIADFETMHACKPQPAFFLEVCSRLGVEPARALMVGNDPVIDIRGAQQVGMATYLVEGAPAPGSFEREVGALVLGGAGGEPAGGNGGGAGSGAAAADPRRGSGPLAGVPEFVRRFTSSARFP